MEKPRKKNQKNFFRWRKGKNRIFQKTMQNKRKMGKINAFFRGFLQKKNFYKKIKKFL